MNTQRRFEIYQAIPNLVSRKPKTPGITAGTPPPSTVPRKTRFPVHPPIGVSKGGLSPLWSFQGGPGGKYEIPPGIFLGKREGIFF